MDGRTARAEGQGWGRWGGGGGVGCPWTDWHLPIPRSPSMCLPTCTSGLTSSSAISSGDRPRRRRSTSSIIAPMKVGGALDSRGGRATAKEGRVQRARGKS